MTQLFLARNDAACDRAVVPGQRENTIEREQGYRKEPWDEAAGWRKVQDVYDAQRGMGKDTCPASNPGCAPIIDGLENVRDGVREKLWDVQGAINRATDRTGGLLAEIRTTLAVIAAILLLIAHKLGAFPF